MSPKDLCTINVLDEILNNGVDVLKIEGRSKSADYVYTVTQCYKEAIQAMEEKKYSKEKIDDWMKRLSTVYNRGFWEGYYLGQNLGEWTPQPSSIATEKKIYIGKGTKYYPKIKVSEFIIETGSIKIGDTIMIQGDKIGAAKEKIETLIVNGTKNNIAIKGDKITFPFDTKITASDKLYKIVQNTNA